MLCHGSTFCHASSSIFVLFPTDTRSSTAAPFPLYCHVSVPLANSRKVQIIFQVPNLRVLTVLIRSNSSLFCCLVRFNRQRNLKHYEGS